MLIPLRLKLQLLFANVHQLDIRFVQIKFDAQTSLFLSFKLIFCPYNRQGGSPDAHPSEESRKREEWRGEVLLRANVIMLWQNSEQNGKER